jgi:tetratricopeptide (TPR) repeat protein
VLSYIHYSFCDDKEEDGHMEKHIFISYNHEDSDFAEVLIHRVEQMGFKTWVDHDQLPIGEDWRNEIDQAIKNSFALIVIMSPEAKASEYVTYEWAFAWGAGVKVLPVIYKSTPLHPRLEALQYLDFTSRAARPLETLLATIQKIVDSFSSSTPPIPQNTSPSIYSASQRNKKFWLDTGRIFLDRNDYQAALEAYKQAIFLDPHSATAYTGKSEVLNRLESYQEALTVSEQAIRLDPDYAAAYSNKGHALYGLKRYEEAVAAYEQAIRLDPNDAVAYNNKGNTLSRLKRYQEALAAHEQAIRFEPNYALAYYGKGITLDEMKRSKEAQQYYKKAHQLGYNREYEQ